MTVSSNEGLLEALATDERYRRLLRRRSRLAWMLTGAMLTIFFGYILLVAFRRDILAQPLFGGVTSVGIPVGIGVIVAGIVLTGIYVRSANKEFDPLLDALRKDYGA